MSRPRPAVDEQWSWHTTAAGSATIAAGLQRQGRPANFGEVLGGWRDDREFRKAWCRWLRDVPIDAYCWELPPLTQSTLSRPFECVFVANPALSAPPGDADAFEEHFAASDAASSAVIFGNLGGDALLVAPRPLADDEHYSHLAKFLRSAPAAQAEELWRFVAEALDRRLGDVPVWLSTAGLGVAWLHVRIDARPKYYRHRPYMPAHFWR